MVYLGFLLRNEVLGMIDIIVDVINKLGLYVCVFGKFIEVIIKFCFLI